MQLSTLINIADGDMSMVLYAKKHGRFNFKTKEWSSDPGIKPENISTVENFVKSKLYSDVYAKKLVTWSTIDPANCSALNDTDGEINIKKNKIISIAIEY